MKHALKYILCFALILALNVGVLCSCGGKALPAETETEAQTSAPAPEKIVLHSKDPDNAVYAEAYLSVLPDRDFGGATFFITTPDTLFIDPDAAKFVSQSVTERNKAVEAKYHVSVRSQTAESTAIVSEMKASLAAGMYYSDLLLTPLGDVGTYAAEGILMNLRSLPLFDPDKPYFNASSVNALSAGYFTYGIAGEATPASASLPAVFFNKDMMSSLTDADVYAEAKDGKFTWDRFFELAALTDGTEAVGAVCEGSTATDAIFVSAGQKYVSSGVGRTPFIAFESYSMNDSASFARRMFAYGENGNVPRESAGETFRYGGALMAVSYMRLIDNFRGNFTLGVLPMPKMSEDDSYRSLAGAKALVMTVPAGTTDSEKTSLVMSALNASSYGIMTEVASDYMHVTTLSDSRSADMVEIITKSAFYDMSTAFGGVLPLVKTGTADLVRRVIEAGDFSTYETDVAYANESLAGYFG